MSTELYLRCEDHDPPLRAYYESGVLRNLEQIQADIAERDALVRITRTDDWIDLGSGRNMTATFLAQHPRCRVGIVDDTGREHPTLTEEDE